MRELREQRQTKKDQIDKIEEELIIINRQILALFDKTGEKEFIDDGLNTQVIQNTTAIIDWDGVKRDLTLAQWKQIIREVPDKKLLEKLVTDGKVKPSALAKHQKIENKGEPFVKVSRARSENE